MGYKKNIHSRFNIFLALSFLSMVFSNLIFFDLLPFIEESERALTTIYVGLWSPTFAGLALRYIRL
jgi:hypothetical protein